MLPIINMASSLVPHNPWGGLVNSNTKWEDFIHVMKNPTWPEFLPDFKSKNSVEAAQAGFPNPRPGTSLVRNDGLLKERSDTASKVNRKLSTEQWLEICYGPPIFEAYSAESRNFMH